MIRNCIRTSVAILAFFAAAAPAGVISLSPTDFTIYAGDDLSIGRNASIVGRIGAYDDIRVNTGSSIVGDIYASDDFYGQARITVSGRTVAGEELSIGAHSSTGALWAGLTSESVRSTRVTVGANSTVGNINSAYNVKIYDNVAVNGYIQAGNDVEVRNNVRVAGRITAVDDLKMGRHLTAGRIDVGDRSRGVVITSGSSVGSVYAVDDVIVNSNATINGDVHAGDDFRIGSNSVVHGSVVYADDLYGQSSSAVIDGTIGRGTADAPDLTIFDRMVWDAGRLTRPDFSYGSQSVSVGRGDVIVLDPGAYKDLVAASRGEIHLTAGEYDFRKMMLSDASKIIVDTSAGDVIINVQDKLWAGRNVMVIRNGAGEITVRTKKDIMFGAGADVSANLTAFDDLSIGANSTLAGSFFYAADNLAIGDGVAVSGGGGAVPEPGTLSLLLVGGGMTMLKRRRKAKA